MDINDPIAAFERALRRRARILVVGSVAGAIVETGVLFFYATSLFGGLPPWLAIVVGLVIPAGVVGFLVLLREQNRRTVEFVRAVRPRIRDATMVSGTGAMLVFDNGLVFLPVGVGSSFWLYGSPSGAVLEAKTARDVQSARRGGYRMRRVVVVGAHRGPSWARERLGEIQDRVGTKQAFASVAERPGTAIPDPSAAAWVAMAMFPDARWSRKADRWLLELDNLRDFLLRLREERPVAARGGS